MPVRSRSGEASVSPGPGWLGRILIIVLGLNVALAWMAIQASLVFAHVVWLAVAGQVLAEAEPGRIAGQIASLRRVQAVLWLGAAGFFLSWIHRTRRTLETLDGPGVRSARGGVGDLLVPGPNLVRIPRAVSALWRGSAGDRTPPTLAAWIAWWWTLCLATVILDLAAIPPGRWLLAWVGFGGGLPLLVLGECVRIAAAVLTIVVVTRIERHRRERPPAAEPARGVPDA